MPNKLVTYLLLSILLLIILATVSLFVGVYEFETDVFSILKSFFISSTEVSEADQYILFDLRLPRIVMGILIGSMLSVSGTCMQGMFKNPLATPDLIGITSGATLFAATSIVLGGVLKAFIPESLHFYLLSLMAFLGSLLTMLIVYKIATVNGKTNVVMMLLTGVAITAIGFAFTGFLIYISKEEQLRDLTFWNLGSLAGATWMKNGLLLVVLLISYFFLLGKGKSLNALMLGENDAKHLGVPVEKIKKQIVVFTALMVGTTVAFSGTIGFVGLVIPYILRLIFKSNYQLILPLSAVFGSILLVVADTISRTIVAPSEIPIGILTAMLGAPVFILILIKNKKSIV
ncbi:iron ABC transporter permease [Flavobacterium azooxidireducens]|uniref:Iron ABC transporter permease n=1 Tax=Flavobacterium azooxidireducens TaxID=1871076 RepID=A0ABY4KB22_9FLAO|nr:iron ABC transporter permease [Flavobacterium azooxidireducens]UPQ77991.1 iron ABC transporter permease [Flavobacterium azooxidireducens]